MNYNFEWDQKKAKSNFSKHRITFEETTTIFYDPLALTIYDEFNSMDEERWITLGISSNGKILVAVHTFKKLNNESYLIRLISCRKATKNEERQYKGE